MTSGITERSPVMTWRRRLANKVLARTGQPLNCKILDAFEYTALLEHKDELDDWMLRWEGVDTGGMKGVVVKLVRTCLKARAASHAAADKEPKWIKQNIEKLGLNERAYHIHLGRLRESGETGCALQMLDYLAFR